MSASRSRWPEVSLGEVCDLKYGKRLPESARTGGDVPVFGSNGEVGKHHTALTAGPTMVVGRKGSFGEVNFSPSPCWPIDTTYYIDGSATKADLHWLAYRLASLGLNKLNKAAAVTGLNSEDAYRQPLFIPPLLEQQRIADILDKADALRAKRRAALAQLDTLTQSIFLDMLGDPIARGTVFGASAPVVVVPEGARVDQIGEHMLVAWNGSREATRAIRGALPLLKRASRITVLEGDPSPSPLGIDTLPDFNLRTWYERRGISAEFRPFKPGKDHGHALLEVANGMGANMIVLGAWGQSRITELVLGGVTRHLFQHSNLPLLVAH